MVWIHGGGFTMGSGNSDRFGPDYLVEKDVVLVTFNYRLGALGFLSTQDKVLPGNLGLRDQVAALQWVRDNIVYFSGDTNNVTIFGESSGGASVHYLMLSPLAKGLFHRAISQSGTALIPGSFSRFSRQRTFRLGEMLGCRTESSEILITYFQDLPAEDLVKAQNYSFSEEEKLRDVLFPFVPCVEPHIDDYVPVLPEEPVILLRKKLFTDVPYIVGLNSHEGIAFVKDVIEDVSLQQSIDTDFQRMIPLDMNVVYNSVMAHKVAESIRNFYFGDRHLSAETMEEFVHLKTDLRYGIAAHKTIKLHALYGSAPVYYYLFSYNGELNSVKKMMKAEHFPGATHGDELNYLFQRTSNTVDMKENDTLTLRRMVRMWTDFAKIGNPTPKVDAEITVTWPPYSTKNSSYIKIDNNLTIEHHLFNKRMEFWTKLYKDTCNSSE